MKKHGKNYKALVKMVDPVKRYTIAEALDLVKKTARAKFTESVDMAVKLGIDPKKNNIRGTVALPAGSGKTVRIAVITKADKVSEAQAAGADVYGAEDLIEKIKGGFLDFDIVIATPDMMGAVGRVGKVLGTKGLMPNPKSGTVSNDIGKTVKEFKSGKVEYRMDKNAVLHLIIGKVDFTAEDLTKNFFSVLGAILKDKPSGFKGTYVKSIALSATMGPGVKLDAKLALETLGEKEI